MMSKVRLNPILLSQLLVVGCTALMSLCMLGGAIAFCQETPGEAEVASAAASDNPLADGQKDVAGRFSRLEDLLLRSAELEVGENPTRAALLQQAVQLSKQAQLSDLLVQAAENLEQKQFSEAIQLQKNSRENLKRLLELLQSENREERVREKRDQVRRWIEETDRLLRLQSSLRGRTEGGQAEEQAAKDQNKLAQKANDIASELKGDDKSKSSQDTPADPQATDPRKTSDQQNDKASESSDAESKAGETGDDSAEGDGSADTESESGEPKTDSDEKTTQGDEPQSGEPQSGEPQSGEPQSGEPQSGEPQSGEPQSGEPQSGEPQSGEPQSGEPQSGEPQSGEPQSGEPQSGEPQSGEPQSGEPQSGEPQSGEPQSAPESKDPTERARQRIEQAQQKMKEAQRELEEAKRDAAVEKQLEAENKLREAIEELEEILRQLREEEIERSLASLETRLRRMLDMQNKVLEETTRLNEIAGDEVSRQVEIRASSLSREERKILAEGERAHLLLREEGSSAAFPEAIVQVNTDVAKVADRLEAADVGRLTIVIQEEIVNSLEEMVQALVQVQKENKEKKQESQPGAQQQGAPGERPLVDKLAEIRLIRTLQIRINKRTTALAEMLSDPADPVGQAGEGDLLRELQGLGERQSNIQRVTRDIVVGKGE